MITLSTDGFIFSFKAHLPTELRASYTQSLSDEILTIRPTKRQPKAAGWTRHPAASRL